MLDSGFMPLLHLCSSDKNVTGGECVVGTRENTAVFVSEGTSIAYIKHCA